jgi:hypothetical protein
MAIFLSTHGTENKQGGSNATREHGSDGGAGHDEAPTRAKPGDA